MSTDHCEHGIVVSDTMGVYRCWKCEPPDRDDIREVAAHEASTAAAEAVTIFALGGIRAHLASLDDGERVEFFENLTEGYCVHCGREVGPGDFCQCENDE